MRRFSIITLSLVVVAAVFVLLHHKEDETPLPNLLEKKINGARMKPHRDSLFGYVINYPDFFEQLPDSLIDEAGCCVFRFWNVVQINLSGYGLRNPDELTSEQMIDSLANTIHAAEIRSNADTIIMSGPLYVDEGVIPGHRYHTKYVRHRRLWFVQSLTYPEECENAVSRLKHQIDNWPVWEDSIPEYPELPQRRPQTTTYRPTRPIVLPNLETSTIFR